MKRQINRALCTIMAIFLLVTLVPVNSYAPDVRATAVETVHTLTIHNSKTVHVEADSAVNAVIKIGDEDISITVETLGAVNGAITVTYDDSHTTKGKILIEKDGTRYFYIVSAGSGTVGLPLQVGDGAYTIIVYKHIKDMQYRQMTEITLHVEGLCDEDVYTNAIQMVDYTKYQDAMDKMNQQLSKAKSDEEKVMLLYKYITSHVKYDSKKVEKVLETPNYLPNLNEVVHSGKAICYDYASLFAAVLRSNQVPTKLVMGYRADMENYHAWNEVLLDGKWIIIDTTIDSSVVQSGKKTAMAKDASLFTKTREY